MNEYNSLKDKTRQAIEKALEEEEVQASVLAQAINYLKTFAADASELPTPTGRSNVLDQYSKAPESSPKFTSLQ